MTGPVAAAILDGGQARRMRGARKSALDVGGRRIIDRQLAALRPPCDPVFVVAPDASPYAGLGLEVVPDLMADGGALGAVLTAIVRSPRDRTLVLAGDLPFISRALVDRLLAEPGADLVIPRTAQGLEPLCALYGRACADPIRRRLERGERRVGVRPEGVTVREIGPDVLAALDPDGLLFVNVNTPQEHARARSLIDLIPQQLDDRITDKQPHS
jgi:molybdopterin-guanine dinucleotide biosynthesis protein A